MKPIRIALIGVNENSHSVQIHTRFQEYGEYFQVAGIAYPENEKERLPHKVEKFSHLPLLTVERYPLFVLRMYVSPLVNVTDSAQVSST